MSKPRVTLKEMRFSGPDLTRLTRSGEGVKFMMRTGPADKVIFLGQVPSGFRVADSRVTLTYENGELTLVVKQFLRGVTVEFSGPLVTDRMAKIRATADLEVIGQLIQPFIEGFEGLTVLRSR